MPKQLDQMPTDPTTLARRVRALEQQMTELRAARRMGYARAWAIARRPGVGRSLAGMSPKAFAPA